MAHGTMIDTRRLAEHLDDDGWLVVDARFALAQPSAGRTSYLDSHIAGAVYADLNEDLSDPPGEGRGRHPLPSVEAMAERFGRLGIGDETQVVVYDARDGMYAARLWWMLKYLGHDAVAVLDGGFAKWTREGRRVATGNETRASRAFSARPRPEMLAVAREVDAARRDATRVVVDSRSPDRYRGENETIDPVAGHIPGARNRFFGENVAESGEMRPAADLRPELDAVLGATAPERAIFYCGSGVTACHNLLALDHAGLTGAKLYAGSWSEWISDPTRPVATGDDDSLITK